ncbi:MAG: hypothetical protein OXH19_09465 [Chloroflexi bacterium]|nr:hypothetical protein [Chloroflexota bacterium]MCY3589166.1 hypothetical protein [Chloroflexota bacterium]MCY3686162.1 hypothetical protein [Chloroflexota bacterium]MDE2708783.1 hypothetical protein [Chloroflexota bacterium]
MKIVLFLLFLGTIAAGLSACRVSNDSEIDNLQVEVARAEESALRAQVLAALEPLDPLRYHHLDRVVREEQRIPAEALIWATRAREILDWVDWPLELEDHVEQYGEWLDSLLAAFHNDDAPAAAEPSKITHALAHTFEATLEAWLNNESLPAVPALAGLEPPMHDESHNGHGEDAAEDSYGE